MSQIKSKETHQGSTNSVEKNNLSEKLKEGFSEGQHIDSITNKLDVNEQYAAIGVLQKNIVKLLVKIKKENPKVDLLTITPGEIGRYITLNKLNKTEQKAFIKLKALSKEMGHVSKHLLKNWSALSYQANEGAKGWGKKLKESFKKDPVKTSLLLAAGIGGAYLLFKGVTKLFSKSKKESAESFLGSFLPSKGTLGALGIIAAGGVLGKKQIMKLLGLESLLDIQEALKNKKNLPKKVTEQLEEQALKLKMEEEIRGKLKNGVEKGKNEVEKQDIGFKAVSILLTNIYSFDKKREISSYNKNDIEHTINSVRKKPISEIIKIYKKYKEAGSIAKGELDNSSSDAKMNFIAINILYEAHNKYKNILKNENENFTVEEFFKKHIANDPTLRLVQSFNKNIGDAIENMDISKINIKEISNVLDKNKNGYIEKLSEKFKIDLSDLEKEEKKDFFIAISNLYMNANINNEPQINKNYSEKTKNRINNFFNKIKKETQENILPNCIKKFNLDKNNATIKANADILKNHLKIENITFKDAIKLNAIYISGNKINKTGELALLLVTIGSIKNADLKESYQAELLNIFIKSPNNFSIKLPSLNIIKPYFNVAKEIAKNKTSDLWDQFNNFANVLTSSKFDNLERDGRVDAIKNATFIDFLSEGGAGAVRIPKELLEAIYNSGVSAAEIYSCESIADLCGLIFANGGNLTIDKESGAGVFEWTGKYFIVKPLSIVGTTVSSWWKGDMTDGIKAYTISSSPFIMLGATHGFIFNKGLANRSSGLLRGALKGAAAPINIPVKGFKLLSKSTIYTKETLENGFNILRELKRGTAPSHNINMLMRDANQFLKYYELQENNTDTAWRMIKRAKQDGVKTTIRRALLGKWNKRMSERYIKNFTKRYNDFFDLYKTTDGMLNIEKTTHSVIFNKAEDLQKLFNNLIKNGKLDKVNNIDELKDLIKESGKMFEKHEIKHLIKRIGKGKNGVKKFKYMVEGATGYIQNKSFIKKAFNKTKSATSHLMSGIKKFKGVEGGTKSVEKIDDVVKGVNKNLKNIHKVIKNAKSDLALAKRTKMGVEKAENILNKALEAEKAILKNSDNLNEINKAGELIETYKKGYNKWNNASKKVRKRMSKNQKVALKESYDKYKDLEKKLKKLISNGEDLMKNADEATEAVGKISKFAKTMKWVGRVGGLGGAAFSFYEAGSSAYKAITTDIEGRAGVESFKAGVYGLNAVADTAAVAVTFGATGTTASIASYAAIPLIPITYAGEQIYESWKEDTITEAEWIQRGSPDKLMHEFFTSANSFSVGDAWKHGFNAALTSETISERTDMAIENKRKTAHKIFKVLIASQKEPKILGLAYGNEKNKNKKIKSEIDKTYNQYHEYYFRNTPNTIDNYQTAQRYVSNALVFDDIMDIRIKNENIGTEKLMIGKFNLMDEKYKITGGVNNPKAKGNFVVKQLIEAFKSGQLKEIEYQNENFIPNFDKMETSYLSRLYIQTKEALREERNEKILGNNNVLNFYMNTIATYLIYSRNVNMASILTDPKFREPKMSHVDVQAQLTDLKEATPSVYNKFESEHFKSNPSVSKIYKLAEFFGYNGDPTEIELRKYFNESNKERRGIYWNGESWMLNESYGRDDEIGKKLNRQTINKFIFKFKNQSTDIFEHRNDSLATDAYDFSWQIKKMVKILEGSNV